MGLKWLAGLFHPDRLGHDLQRTTREFYQLFYHVDLSETELESLIA
jgi:iron complex transport system substrate-binding protein